MLDLKMMYRPYLQGYKVRKSNCGQTNMLDLKLYICF